MLLYLMVNDIFIFIIIYNIYNSVYCKSFAVVKRCLLNKSITHLLTYMTSEMREAVNKFCILKKEVCCLKYKKLKFEV